MGGRLTRTPDHQKDSVRGRLDHIGVAKYGGTEDEDALIIERVRELADARGVSMAAIAIAWELENVTAPIVGITNPDRVGDVVAAVNVRLTDKEIAYLDEPHIPHRLVGVMARYGR